MAKFYNELEAVFGPVRQPIEWFGVNEYGLNEALAGMHVINREGVFSVRTGSKLQGLEMEAYVAGRLSAGRQLDDLHWSFGAGATGNFGVVCSIGDISGTEAVLGRPFNVGRCEDEVGIQKAKFVCVDGLAATVRQAVRGLKTGLIVNKGGYAEVSIQEILPDALTVIRNTITR